MSYYDNPWEDLRGADHEDAQVELDVARAERVRLERQLAALKQEDPEAATIAQLARDLGEDAATVRAKIEAVKAAAQAKPATPPNYAALDAGLAKATNDAEAVRALQQAGFATTHDVPNRDVTVPADIVKAHQYLEAADSFEEYERRLGEVGLLDRSSEIAW